MELEQVVSRDPSVVSRALVFRGTRVPVQTLIDYLKSGETLDRFLERFPTVSREQVGAYLELTRHQAEAHSCTSTEHRRSRCRSRSPARSKQFLR